MEENHLVLSYVYNYLSNMYLSNSTGYYYVSTIGRKRIFKRHLDLDKPTETNLRTIFFAYISEISSFTPVIVDFIDV